ncbi:methyltransferase [Streptomyces triticagri]|uniref:Methyltransferase n=1 Tax=Streptomyces triticagri TaxID=2293568 RepID=A0A372M0C2_9ACTN|nr:methyltransferase [Streptomyces triticagri]RFU84394.1 methyltransferase [Streptomyces triticagri]
MSQQQSVLPPRLRLIEIVSAGWISAAVSALADLGIADHLDRPRTAAELAALSSAEPEALSRFLDAAAAAGVLTAEEDGRFALTGVGAVLRSDSPDSMREMCRLTGMEEFARTWAHCAHTARTGAPAFDAAHGRSAWEYMSDPGHADFSTAFHRAMAESAAGDTVNARYDFPEGAHVVDVGGGRGAMLARLLTEHPHLAGTVFDLPNAVRGAAELLADAGVSDRATVAAGSFFDGVPTGGDVYLLSRVIGNWNDEDSVRILRRVREAMSPASRLVIVGHMPTADDRTHYVRALDLYMFVLLQARLRTPEQYRLLFEQAGLALSRADLRPDAESLIEARPV